MSELSKVTTVKRGAAAVSVAALAAVSSIAVYPTEKAELTAPLSSVQSPGLDSASDDTVDDPNPDITSVYTPLKRK